jgi:hypothetical protein
MGRLGGLRTVIMEDVGVAMDQQGVESHVRPLSPAPPSPPLLPCPFLHLDSIAYQGRKTNHLQLVEMRGRHMLMSSGRMPMSPRRGECTPRSR